MIDRRGFVGGAAALLAGPAAPVARGAGRASSGGEFSVWTLHNFKDLLHGRAGPADIISPMFQASDGALYGTSLAGGANDGGTLYRMKADGKGVKVLHDFETAGWDRGTPRPGLIQGADGKLYGTHRFGGESGHGMVYAMSLHGRFEIVHSFEGGRQGNGPVSPLIQASDGCFYGTTFEGGVADHGTVYRVKPGGGFKVLHSFRGEPHGSRPIGGLLEARDGFLYGTTYHGGRTEGVGTYGMGTLFKMDHDGRLAALHHMSSQGRAPAAALVQTRDGEIFGTARFAGTGWWSGSFFQLTRRGGLRMLHQFVHDVEGELPNGILEASDGQLYVTTTIGAGHYGGGAVVRMGRDGGAEVVHVFNGDAGDQPVAGLIEDATGRFIGTTRYSGRTGGHGTVFALSRR